MEEDSLLHLSQKAAECGHLENKLQALQDQRRVVDQTAVSLQVDYRLEQEDVEKLEGRSLTNYFFQVIGKMDDKLDQQRQEAYAAKVKLDAAQAHLAGIDHDIQEILEQLHEGRIAKAQYRQELEKKRALIRHSGSTAGEELLAMEERMAGLKAQKKEIQEAISAGIQARTMAERILDALSSADDWNTWDMLGGGGIITHMAKYSHLDDAQDMVQALQSRLRRYQTELADIQISADLQVSVDGFLRFADYFFDGLFVDWAVGDRIDRSQGEVRKVERQIERMQSRLSQLESDVDREMELLKEQMDRLVVQA